VINYCTAHKKEHDHFSWKFRDYEDDEGQKTGWFCGDLFKPTAKEWVPDRIKNDRNAHWKDIVQPWRDGEPSREFQEAYPHRAAKMFTEKERKTSKYVWRDIAPK
jgi:hypothetical protein